MAVRVSVVVATYNSPPGLDDLIASLDAQTLPADEFELVVVDDGSTDDTFDRLQRLAAERPNMHVDRIPNSGWPGRPRNVGTSAAVGDYVFYADHDDYFFPEALERMHRFAVDNDLDVVHPKEVVMGWGRPGWVAFRHHVPRVEALDQVVLQCITPHKLYRRSFLAEHQIWFPEGRVRLEDFSINALAWAHTDAIGVLADYPCYQWIIHRENSHRASYDYDVYWRSFTSSLQPVLELPEGDKKDQLLIRWYRSRVLERVAASDEHDPAYSRRLMDTFAGLLDFFPPHLDRLLTPADRARSVLLREGRVDLLRELAALDRELVLAVSETELTWHEGQLRLELSAGVVDAAGAPVALRVTDDRVLRDVPPALARSTPAWVWDVTDALTEAFGEVVIRSRQTAVDWILPSRSEVRVEDGHLRLRVTTEVDVSAAAAGRPLEPESYDVFVRLNGLGWTGTRRVPAGSAGPSAALVDGRAVVVLETRSGNLCIDLSGALRNVVGVAGLQEESLRTGPDGTRVALRTVHVRGRSELPVTLEVADGKHAALLVADGERAWITSADELARGGAVSVTVQGRRSRDLLQLTGAGPGEPAHHGRAAGARTAVRFVARSVRRALGR